MTHSVCYSTVAAHHVVHERKVVFLVHEGSGRKRWIVEHSKESVGCEKDRGVQFLVP